MGSKDYQRILTEEWKEPERIPHSSDNQKYSQYTADAIQIIPDRVSDLSGTEIHKSVQPEAGKIYTEQNRRGQQCHGAGGNAVLNLRKVIAKPQENASQKDPVQKNDFVLNHLLNQRSITDRRKHHADSGRDNECTWQDSVISAGKPFYGDDGKKFGKKQGGQKPERLDAKQKNGKNHR